MMLNEANAIEVAGPSTSPQSRRRLLEALGHKDDFVRLGAMRLLRDRAGEDGFAKDLYEVFDETQRRLTDQLRNSVLDRRAVGLFDVATSSHLAYAPLAGALRDCARSHWNEQLRDIACMYLVTNLADPVFCAELLARIDSGPPFESLSLAAHAGRAAVRTLSPAKARISIERLVESRPHEEREELWYAVTFGIPRDEPAWVHTLVDWWRSAAPGRARDVFAKPIEYATCLDRAYDMDDPAAVARLSAFYRDLGDNFRIQRALAGAMADAGTMWSITALVELLDVEPILPDYFLRLCDAHPVELARALPDSIDRAGWNAPLGAIAEVLLELPHPAFAPSLHAILRWLAAEPPGELSVLRDRITAYLASN